MKNSSLSDNTRVPVTAPLLIAAVLLLLRLSQFLIPRNETNAGNIFLALIIIQIVVFVLPSILYYYSIDRKLKTPMLVRFIRPSHLVFMVFVIIMFISGNMLLKFFMYFISDGTTAGDSSVFNTNLLPNGENNQIYTLLTFAFIPALCEELFFRGVILSEYRSLGGANAVIVSALSFAMVHFSYDNFLVYFFSGAVFGFSAIVTRSIFTPMILHMINNLLNLYVDDSFLRLMMRESGIFFVAFVLILLFCGSLFLVLSRTEAILLSYSEKPMTKQLPPRSKPNFAKVFLSPAFLVLVGVFIVITGFNN